MSQSCAEFCILQSLNYSEYLLLECLSIHLCPIQGMLAMKPQFLKMNVSELSLWVRINLCFFFFSSLKYNIGFMLYF